MFYKLTAEVFRGPEQNNILEALKENKYRDCSSQLIPRASSHGHVTSVLL